MIIKRFCSAPENLSTRSELCFTLGSHSEVFLLFASDPWLVADLVQKAKFAIERKMQNFLIAKGC